MRQRITINPIQAIALGRAIRAEVDKLERNKAGIDNVMADAPADALSSLHRLMTAYTVEQRELIRLLDTIEKRETSNAEPPRA